MAIEPPLEVGNSNTLGIRQLVSERQNGWSVTWQSCAWRRSMRSQLVGFLWLPRFGFNHYSTS